MEPCRFHVFVCDPPRAEGVLSGFYHGSAQVIDAFRFEIAKGIWKMKSR